MAVKSCTITRIDENTIKFFWETIANGDTGVPIDSNYADYADRHVQVTGTFGTGGNLRVDGSLDGSTYGALNDFFGNALNITVAGVKGVAEVPLLTRPNATAGDGTTDLDVTIICRRTRSGKAV